MDQPLRVLYAEDDAADADLTREYFAHHAVDIRLDVVITGEACLATLRQHTYDALLVDYHLPDMDAVDVLKVLAERDSTLPTIVATAVGDEDVAVRVLRLGAWDYVPKQGDYIALLPSVVRQAVADYRRLHDDGHPWRRRQRRILYIEHDPADIDLTTRHLAEIAPHMHVDVVRSAAEGLEWLNMVRFDLALVDLRMSDLTALDFLREARRRGLAVPVIVVTGKGDEVTAVAALKLGAYDYICKRDGYLTQLPYAVDNAIDRFQLTDLNRRLRSELAHRERGDAERTRLSEQLLQSQKLESLGRLAGGVAHDFNNLLTVIGGHADLMLRELRDDDPMAEHVKAMRAAARRASDLTRQLLAFSRRQLLQFRVLDLNVAIRESSKMLRRLLSEDVELVTTLDPALGRVNADPGQLDQILFNLAVNAKDAMPRGGRLTIETRNVIVDEAEAQRHASFQPGSYVMLAIADNGVGIDKDVLPYIFEPFFTTKEPGKGTGLGLSTVYGIVKQSGGWIWVTSEAGQGTTLKIFLPPVDAPVSIVAAPVEGENPRGSETVLVVEDEDSVRTLTCRVLRAHGYHVIEAPNGQAALAACETHRLPIPLLITDVVMPRMSGPELATRLKQLRAGIKVLYTSGYADAAVVEHEIVERSTGLLQKPFTPAELTRKVREVLDE